MPTSAPNARYDSPWKTALAFGFRDFMLFFFAKLCAQIDWSVAPRFRDKELAQAGLGDAPAGRVADMLVEVRLLDGSRPLVLVHIEVQAQRDPLLARRVFDYNVRLFMETRRPVASLVVLADEDPHWRPHCFYVRALGTEMGISFPIAKLLDYAADLDALRQSDNPFALVTLAHLQTMQARHDPDQLYAAKWHLTKLLYQHGWSKRRIITLFKVINWMMALPPPQQERYWRAVLQLEKEMKVEWISPLEQSFLERGAAELLECQLTQRFGPLPQTVRKKLHKADVGQLQAWGRALLEAQSLREVFR